MGFSFIICANYLSHAHEIAKQKDATSSVAPAKNTYTPASKWAFRKPTAQGIRKFSEALKQAMIAYYNRAGTFDAVMQRVNMGTAISWRSLAAHSAYRRQLKRLHAPI